MDIIPDLGTLGLQVVNFLILFTLLRWKLFGPVIKMMEDREEKIKSDLDKAEQSRKEALDLKGSYEVKLKEADKEARAIIDKAVAEGEQAKSGLIEKGREEVVKMKKAGEEHLHIEKEKAASELVKEISGFSVKIASKLIEKNIDEEANKKLIVDFVREMDK